MGGRTYRIVEGNDPSCKHYRWLAFKGVEIVDRHLRESSFYRRGDLFIFYSVDFIVYSVKVVLISVFIFVDSSNIDRGNELEKNWVFDFECEITATGTGKRPFSCY